MKRLGFAVVALALSAALAAAQTPGPPSGGGGGGGTPGGSNGNVQYNNSGAFGGASDFNYSASGTQLGSPTGGAEGAGTINVQSGVYNNGTLLANSTGTSLGVAPLLEQLPNLASPGTTANTLTIYSGNAVTAALTTSTTNAMGICVSNCGTTGNALIAIGGQVGCVFDGATTAGDFVEVSTTVGGDCHDAGATVPTNVGVYGVVLSTNASGGTYSVDLSPVGVASALVTQGNTKLTASAVYNFRGGLGISNDGTSPNTVIDTAAGAATSDDGTITMTLAAFTKTTGAWVAGSGNGCLDTGSVASSTWYHLFLIAKNNGAVDELCSTSATAPSLPSGYTKKRRFSAFKTDASAHILAFTEVGNVYWWGTPVLDLNTSSLGTSATLETLASVPIGVKVQPICRYAISGGSPPVSVLLTSPDEADSAPGTTTPFSAVPGYDQLDESLVAGVVNSACPVLTTNTSQQIRARASAASTTLAIVTRGWAETQ